MNISIIIPCHNEERFLQSCLDSINNSYEELLKTLDLKNKSKTTLEIVVVLNRCTDKTKDIAEANNCKYILNNDKNLSKIRNAGVKASIGEFIFTIDADSRMSKNLIPKAIKDLKSDKYIAGGVNIIPERISLGIALTGLMIIPVVLSYGVTAGVFYFKRETFEAVGGFNENWFSAEDIEFGRKLKSYGKSKNKKYKNSFSSYIVTSCRKFDRFGDWYFLKQPRKVFSLLFNKNKELADKIWYDFND